MLSSPLRIAVNRSRCSSAPSFGWAASCSCACGAAALPSAPVASAALGPSSELRTTCKNSCVAVSARSNAIWYAVKTSSSLGAAEAGAVSSWRSDLSREEASEGSFR